MAKFLFFFLFFSYILLCESFSFQKIHLLMCVYKYNYLLVVIDSNSFRSLIEHIVVGYHFVLQPILDKYFPLVNLKELPSI